MGYTNHLITGGLTNRETPDISELTTCRNRESDSWCNSIPCTGGRPTPRSFGVRKYVSKQTTFCKDCGSALFWRCRERREETA